MQDCNDKGSARCNWVFYAHVTRGRKSSRRENRRQKRKQKQELLGPEENVPIQVCGKQELSCTTVGDTRSAGESESISSRHTSAGTWSSFIPTPSSLTSNESTLGDNSDALLTLSSDRSCSSYTKQECNRPADQCKFDETLIINNRATHFSEIRQENLRASIDPHLLLTFQEFLVTHSAFPDSSVLDNPCINRRTVLKVSLTDFAGLSDKICVKCRSRMYDSGARKSTKRLCQDLFNQTKVVLHRINPTQQSMYKNRQDCGSSMNEWKFALKNNSHGLSPDLNGNVKDMYLNKNLISNNWCENITVKSLCDTDHMTLSKSPVFTKDHLNGKGTKEDKRKLPPLKIPKEISLPQNDNNYDTELQDDETPEYPLQEGEFFFKSQASKQELFKKENQVETTEQSRNVFSDFLTELPYPEQQILRFTKKSSVNGNKLENPKALNSPIIARSLKMSFMRQITSTALAETTSYESSYNRSSNIRVSSGTVEINERSFSNNLGNNKTSTNITSNIDSSRVITHGDEDNHTVNTMGCGMRNEGLDFDHPSEKSLIKLDKHLLQPFGQTLQPSLNGKRKTDTSQHKPTDIGERSTITEVQYSSRSQVTNGHSAGQSLDRKQSNLLKKVTTNLQTSKRPSENVSSSKEMSEKCRLSFIHSKDYECEHSASKSYSTSVKFHQDLSEHTISTVKINSTDRLEIAEKTVNITDINAKSNEKSLSHECKQLPVSSRSVSEATSLVLSPKRHHCKRVESVTTSNGPDSYDTVEAMSQETEHKAPRKKLKRTELFDMDNTLGPTPNVSSTHAMVDEVDLESTKNKQTPPVPKKQNSMFDRAVRVSPCALSSSAGNQREEQPTIQREAVPTVSPQLHELHSNLVRTAPIGMLTGCQLYPTRSEFKFLGCNLERNLRQISHLVSQPPLSYRADPLVMQKKVTEPSDKINANQTKIRKSKLFSSSLTKQSNDCTVVDKVNYNPNQSSFQKANSPKGNTTLLLSSVLAPYVFKNMSPLMYSAKIITDYPVGSERNHKNMNDSQNNSNQSEQSSGKFNVSKTSSSKSEAFGSKMNSMHQPSQPSASGEINCSKTSVEQPNCNPLWGNTPFKSHLSADTNVRSTMVLFNAPKLVDKKVAKRRYTQNYSNLMPFPLQGQVNLVNQQVPWGSVQHSVETEFYENVNMLRHAPTIQVTQQNNAEQQTVPADEKVKYPSWVKIPNEQICSNQTFTAASKSLSSQSGLNSNLHALSEKDSYKSHHAHVTPTHNVFLKDSSVGSVRSGCDRLGSPREQERSEQVDSFRDPSPPCEPLDLSQSSGKRAFYCDSINPVFNVQQKYSMPGSSYNQLCKLKLSGNHVNVDRPHSAELQKQLSLNSSSHHVPSQTHTKGNNEDIAASRTQPALLKTASTNSLPEALLSTKMSVPHNFTLSQSVLRHNNISEENNVHSINIHSKSSISQVTSPCERNEHWLSAQTTTEVEQQNENHLPHLAVSTSAQLKDLSVITCSPLKSCFPNHQMIVSTSSSVLKQSNMTQPSVAQPVVASSASDLTKVMKSSDSKLVHDTALSPHVVCSSVSLSSPKHLSRAYSDSFSLPSTLRHQSHNIKDNLGTSTISRLVPLPIKDFFTHTPKENAYSSLLMAEITSQSKRRLGLQKNTDIFPLAQSQKIIDGSTLEVSNSLQRKLVIDLTEGNDDCDVVSISSKDSFDDDSAIDFLDMTMRDRVPTPGSITASSSISETTVIEGSKNLQPTALSNELINSSLREDINCVPTDKRGLYRASYISCNDYAEQSGLMSTNISDIEVTTPKYINDSCHVHDLQGRKEDLVFDETEFSYDIISDNEETTETNKTDECPVPPCSAHSGLTHNLRTLNGSESFEIPNKLTAENSIPPSHLLKFVPEFKDIMARKLRSAVASRTTCGKLPSGDLMAPIETSHAQKLQHETKQQQIMNSPLHQDNIKLSTHDNSTQRAAATLLELSANPLYNPYTIGPETSDDYQEKVYHVHPTLDASEIGRRKGQDDGHGTHTASEKSRARTGRRVGRPPKYQFCSDTAESEENGTILSHCVTSYNTSSNSAPSVRINTVQHSNRDTSPTQSNSFYTAEHSVGAFYGCPLKPPIAKRGRRTKTVPNLINPSYDSVYQPVITKNCQTQDVSSTYTGLANTCTNIRQKFVPVVYDHTVNALHNNSNDYDKQFVKFNTPDNLSNYQRSGHSSSNTKQKPKQTENKNGKRQRKMSIQENMQIIEEPSSKMFLKTDNFMSNAKVTTCSSNIESPTFQGPLNVIIGNEEVNPANTILSVTELGNNLAENESENKSIKKRAMEQSKKKYGNLNESFISNILQQFISKEEVGNIVVETSFEDGLPILSLHSEIESDFNHQSPQNGDQIVPVNKAHTQDSWLKTDAVISQHEINTQNENTDTSQQLPKNKLTHLQDSEPHAAHSDNNIIDNEAAREIEKEKAVTSLLAEMMHSKITGYVPC